MDTNELYDKLWTWMLTYGPRILIAIIILFIGLWLIKLFRNWLTTNMHKRQIDSSLKSFVLSLLITLGYILLILGVMQILGVQMTLFAALIGGIGVALGLALSGTLQNFTSGILILVLKPYKVGDNIVAQGQEGTVMSIEIFYTVVNTFDNKTVIIPNSKLSNEVIINLSREGIRRLDIELSFGFSYTYETIRDIIQQSIKETKEVLEQPEARIGINSLEPNGYKVGVNVWLNAHGFIDAKLKLQEKIMNDLKASDIKLPGME